MNRVLLFLCVLAFMLFSFVASREPRFISLFGSNTATALGRVDWGGLILLFGAVWLLLGRSKAAPLDNANNKPEGLGFVPHLMLGLISVPVFLLVTMLGVFIVWRVSEQGPAYLFIRQPGPRGGMNRDLLTWAALAAAAIAYFMYRLKARSPRAADHIAPHSLWIAFQKSLIMMASSFFIHAMLTTANFGNELIIFSVSIFGGFGVALFFKS